VLAGHLNRSVKSARVLFELGVEKGMPAADALHGTGLVAEQLFDPTGEIATRQEQRLIENLVAAFPDDPDIGLEAGSRYTVSSFGMLGFATLTSPSLRDSLQIALRYQDLGFTLAQARLVREHHATAVELDVSQLPVAIRRFVVDHQLATFWASFPSIAGPPPTPRIDVTSPRPVDTGRYRSTFGTEPHFLQAHNRISVPDHYLDGPLPQADPDALALCERQCLDLLARRKAQVGVTGVVRDRLTRASHGIPTMHTVARDLHTTTRSLRRELRRAGTTFRDLDEAVRRQRAHELLTGSDLTVEAIAAHIGYATTSAFSHAFKRWHGTSPGAFRRHARERS
jgi:AraC-like DNA-binding protein